MRLTNKGRAVAVAALVVGISGTSWIVNHESPQADKGDCTVMVAGTVSDAAWNRLIANGWKGNPDDDMEALWSPECSVPTQPMVNEAKTVWVCPDGWEFQESTFTCELPWTN